MNAIIKRSPGDSSVKFIQPTKLISSSIKLFHFQDTKYITLHGSLKPKTTNKSLFDDLATRDGVLGLSAVLEVYYRTS